MCSQRTGVNSSGLTGHVRGKKEKIRAGDKTGAMRGWNGAMKKTMMVLLAQVSVLHGWVPTGSAPFPWLRPAGMRATGAGGYARRVPGRCTPLTMVAISRGLPPPPPPKRQRDFEKVKELQTEAEIEKLMWEEKQGRTKAQKGRTTAFHADDEDDDMDLVPREGLFYHDKNGNLRRMKFAFDLEKGEGELEADEIYYDFMGQDADSQLAWKGDEEWDEWRKRASDWMFFDNARVYVKGGDGGDGEVAYRREAHVSMGGPFGGTGGAGGDVIFVADEGDNTLASVRANLHMIAKSGGRGQGKAKTTANADDHVVRVPLGTIVRDEKTGVLLGDMSTPGQTLRVANGGRGGRGNWELANSKNSVPDFAELGEKGQGRWLDLQLKLLADVGVVGVPNAGKSSVLASVTNAKPKIADYPFTTVVPNLGVCQLPGAERRTLVLADIPGLLEGAHQGVGLGQAFLRHIERCRVLLHVIDGTSQVQVLLVPVKQVPVQQ
jgi:Obg family GTPase CgtA